MERCIIVGIDFSPYGEAAMEAAVSLAQDLDVGVVLVHALPSHILPTGESQPLPDAPTREAAEDEDAAVTLSTEWASKARESGIEVDSMVADGVAATLLVEEAEKRGAAMIVVGTHGRSGLKHLLLGSVAEQVVRRSHVPVLVVPHRE